VTVQRELDRNRALGLPTDFWHLTLPAETRAYVPRLLALKRLMAEPERYGMNFAPMPNEPYFAVIDTGSQIDLKIVAKLAGTNHDEIVALNPGFNRWATDPDGPHRMLVPIDTADAFETALKTLGPSERVLFVTHTVGPRETLASIARQYGTSVAVIAKLNDLHGMRAGFGETLKIPAASDQLPEKVLVAAARIDRPATDFPDRKLHKVFYRVRAGDTLSAIARRQGVPVSALARLNDMNPGEALVKGQQLVIKASIVKTANEVHYRDAERLASGKRLTYTVRRGDTVYSISRQFQVSVTQLKTWNGLNQRHPIFAGQHLVMYVSPTRHAG
jgi:membrane-bound lytic murein transglycosylase D